MLHRSDKYSNYITELRVLTTIRASLWVAASKWSKGSQRVRGRVKSQFYSQSLQTRPTSDFKFSTIPKYELTHSKGPVLGKKQAPKVVFTAILVLLKIALLCWDRMVKVYPIHFRCLLVAQKAITELSVHVININATNIKFMDVLIDIQINTYIHRYPRS